MVLLRFPLFDRYIPGPIVMQIFFPSQRGWRENTWTLALDSKNCLLTVMCVLNENFLVTLTKNVIIDVLLGVGKLRWEKRARALLLYIWGERRRRASWTWVAKLFCTKSNFIWKTPYVVLLAILEYLIIMHTRTRMSHSIDILSI